MKWDSASRIVLLSVIVFSGWHPVNAQIKVDLINEVGAKGPCLGFGLGMAIVHKCVSRAEKEGFIRVSEVGQSGLTIGKEGTADGTVTAIKPGSAAVEAGIEQGDQILSVNGKPIEWTPAMSVARQTFGQQGKTFQLGVRPEDGAPEKQVTIVRGQAPLPEDTPKGSMMLPLMPLVDWRGRFVPCTAAGPMMAAVDALCAKIYAPYGYVRAKEAGAAGFTVKSGPNRTAVVENVSAGSGAAAAGLEKGEIITAVDGKPLTGSSGELATQSLFGKAGDRRTMVLRRGDKEITATLVLQEQ